jgi:16S rRNA (guanine(966)-N(2))-methyltransferase RsmD
MRVIAGKYKSRLLDYPHIKSVRPTMDRVKESVFNVLGDSVEGGRVLDLFAGSGSLGIEALSRGAASVVFVESHPVAIGVLRKNIEALKIQDMCTVLGRDVLPTLSYLHDTHNVFDLIILDPPYGTDLTKKTLMKIYASDILAPNGNMVVEHSAHDQLPSSKDIGVITHKEFGETFVTFFNKP